MIMSNEVGISLPEAPVAEHPPTEEGEVHYGPSLSPQFLDNDGPTL
jgi:hypothetical protein